jgi:hypothetical protein
MSVTYFVALPFINSEEGPLPGEAMECPNEGTALLRAEAMSRKEGNVGALVQANRRPEPGKFWRGDSAQNVRVGAGKFG